MSQHPYQSKYLRHFAALLLLTFFCFSADAQQIKTTDGPGELDIRAAGVHSIRITLKPISYAGDFPNTPALADRIYDKPVISLRNVNVPIKQRIGNLIVEVAKPLTVTISDLKGHILQKLSFGDDGKLDFKLANTPVYGLGEGGPLPKPGVDWRTQPVEYDRRGRYFKMQPRWQADAYGSRNPAPVLVTPGKWGLFVAAPWVEVDLTQHDHGTFIPWQPTKEDLAPQTEKNQGQRRGKGLPPVSQIVKGLYDVFVFDAQDPSAYQKDFSTITGPAAMPPKWALGYMQSHRTLTNDAEMIGEADTFRQKKIPLDAMIYLGTGFTPRGWNKKQPSFEFNPEVFKGDPKNFLADMHQRNVKVVLHMVPLDRDKLPSLRGNIPAKPDETIDAGHIQTYWDMHIPLVKQGVDAFWPDEGDWFDLYERIKRHQLYYQGSLQTTPNVRPWSLQRNGFPGIAQWGGWVWSGDVESSWKALEAQIAVGLNYSVSIGPFWGSDIGGFQSNAELTGELYMCWFQFSVFTPSFRSHGQTWRVHRPWGWGQKDMGPPESKRHPLESALNNPNIEPVIKKYDELRYQLLPYNYSLVWQARHYGMPMMRPLWMHYPTDTISQNIKDEYLWGRDMLIAPIYNQSGFKNIYLPKGLWYDWWTDERPLSGGLASIKVNPYLKMPIYVRAGAIIPFDPVRQYTAEKIVRPTTLRIYQGANGYFTLYSDDGISQEYLQGKASQTKITWNDARKRLTLQPIIASETKDRLKPTTFIVQLFPGGKTRTINYNGGMQHFEFGKY